MKSTISFLTMASFSHQCVLYYHKSEKSVLSILHAQDLSHLLDEETV